jgi:hypothetical protein
VIHLLGTLSLIVGAAASIAFVALYGVSARWYRSPEGRHLMTFTGAIGTILVFTAYRNLSTTARPSPLGVEIARLVIFGAVAALLVWRFGLLWRIQHRHWRRTRTRR